MKNGESETESEKILTDSSMRDLVDDKFADFDRNI
jgi:hypothetical protein